MLSSNPTSKISFFKAFPCMPKQNIARTKTIINTATQFQLKASVHLIRLACTSCHMDLRVEFL